MRSHSEILSLSLWLFILSIMISPILGYIPVTLFVTSHGPVPSKITPIPTLIKKMAISTLMPQKRRLKKENTAWGVGMGTHDDNQYIQCPVQNLIHSKPTKDSSLYQSIWKQYACPCWLYLGLCIGLIGWKKKKTMLRSSHCGPMGSAVSLWHQDTGSIPSPTQWVKGSGTVTTVALLGPSPPHAACWPKKEKKSNPHCGTMGSVASWKPWDVGLIPCPAQWVKDPELLQLWLRLQPWLGSHPWRGNSICHRAANNNNNNKKSMQNIFGESINKYKGMDILIPQSSINFCL